MPTGETRVQLMFEGQAGHGIGLALLLVALYMASGIDGFADGRFLGLSTTGWAMFTVANAIAHQVYVWACWRSELHGQALSRLLGDKAFSIYAAVFTVFMVLRLVLVFALGWANRGTLPIEPRLGYVATLVLFGLVVWLVFCLVRYFTFRRAFGIDHFDEAYRGAELVRRGIFRVTPNAMYTFGLLALWIPAFLFQSIAALAVAAFCHAYAWVHYFCTEKPDMKRIYG